MGLLAKALPLHMEFDIAHMHRLAAIGLGDDGDQIVLDLIPYLQERLCDRARVLGGQDFTVGVIVEQRSALAPSHEHRLGGAHDDPHDGLQGLGPLRRMTDVGHSPVQFQEQPAGLAAVFEDLQNVFRHRLSQGARLATKPHFGRVRRRTDLTDS